MVTEGMNGAEMWRVVLADGEVRKYDAFFARGATWRADDARRAVMALAANEQLSVAEILAPGEPTRAELLAQLAADDPAKDDTDEAHPAWWRGYNADKGELAHRADFESASARTARALVALLEAERDEARTKQHAAEAEVTRLRAENDVLRKSTDAAVDGVRAMLPDALRVAREEGEAAAREWAANVCERMVVGGCACSEEQAIAGRALLEAASNIRTLPIAAHYEVKP